MQTLTTDRLELVPLEPERDAKSLQAMHGDSDHDSFGPSAPSPDIAATHSLLTEALECADGWIWVLRLRPRSVALGTIGLLSMQGTIGGPNWGIRRDYWGRGLMGEAALVVVDHLLAQPGIEVVEAWIDTENTRSIGVARRARLDERARLNRVYADHTAQQVVMARAAQPRDPEVLAVRPRLSVRDVSRTCQHLIGILGLTLRFELGDPPALARLALGPWSGSPGLDVERSSSDGIAAVTITVDVGVPTDVVYERALAVGMAASEPVDQPWHAREFEFTLPEGHQIRVVGPSRPESAR